MTTNKIGTKTSALKANPALCLKNLCKSKNGLSEDDLDKAAQYLTHVLKKGTHCKTMNELRGHIYHHSQDLTLEKLPPTVLV